MTPGQGLRVLVLQPRTNGVESIWGAPLGPPTPHTPSVFLPLPASTDRWKRTCPFRSPRGRTSRALATDRNFPSTCVRRARGTSPCALGSPGSTSAGPRNAGFDPAPLRPAPPRCRNGARHLLFTPSRARPGAELERELDPSGRRGRSFEPGGSHVAVPAPGTPQPQVRSPRASLRRGSGRWGGRAGRSSSGSTAAECAPAPPRF